LESPHQMQFRRPAAIIAGVNCSIPTTRVRGGPARLGRRKPTDGASGELPDANVRPSELNRRATAVAVCTSDFALFNLCQDGIPTVSLVHKAVDRLALLCRINVVEIENDGVCLAAVDARAAGNVLPNLLP